SQSRNRQMMLNRRMRRTTLLTLTLRRRHQPMVSPRRRQNQRQTQTRIRAQTMTQETASPRSRTDSLLTQRKGRHLPPLPLNTEPQGGRHRKDRAMAPRKRKYLVTLQIGTGGESPADRQPLYGRENESTVVEAVSLDNAVRKARNRAANPRDTGIVAADEIHGKPFISDERIYTALFEEADDCVRLAPDAYDPGLSTYIDLDFNSVVKDVEA